MQDSLFEIRLPLVNGARLKQARELRGLTQAALADAVYIDQTMVAHIERGTKQPASDLLETIAQILEFPAAYFRQDSPIEMSRGSLLFRSKAIMGKRSIAQAYEYGRLAVEFAVSLSRNATLIPVRLTSSSDPLEAARELRKLLELPDGPIANVVRCVERLGVIIVPLPELRDCDAYATWAGANNHIPVIGLASGRPVDRVRMNVAHELGHLVLHRSAHMASKENESEAYMFAAEFLMPATSIYPELAAEKLSLFRLAELKKKWHVSMQAILRRARELNVITDRQYRYSMLQISQRGWRIDEPSFDSHVERPRALRKLCEVVYGGKEQWSNVASQHNLNEEYLSSLLEACEGGSVPERAKWIQVSPKILSFPA
jgi:Zn-dependent peptidase ImmA (M78 family)/DNA-binding XRE family transcriptional regulator